MLMQKMQRTWLTHVQLFFILKENPSGISRRDKFPLVNGWLPQGHISTASSLSEDITGILNECEQERMFESCSWEFFWAPEILVLLQIIFRPQSVVVN